MPAGGANSAEPSGPDDAPEVAPGVVLTVGHGRLAGQSFVRLVAAAGADELVDVRRTPFSRRNPQFNRDRLASVLAEAGVGYQWWEALGGRRETEPGSPNSGVVAAELRGYADHLGTGEGRAALSALAERAREAAVAVMCAERDPGRCHRHLLADALTSVAGLPVVHLTHDGDRWRHQPHPSVRDAGGTPRWDRATDRPLDV